MTISHVKPMDDRVKAALRREGEASAPTLARGMGERQTSVHSVLVRGVAAGWCRLVRKDGQMGIYALVAREERAQ